MAKTRHLNRLFVLGRITPGFVCCKNKSGLCLWVHERSQNKQLVEVWSDTELWMNSIRQNNAADTKQMKT